MNSSLMKFWCSILWRRWPCTRVCYSHSEDIFQKHLGLLIAFPFKIYYGKFSMEKSSFWMEGPLHCLFCVRVCVCIVFEIYLNKMDSFIIYYYDFHFEMLNPHSVKHSSKINPVGSPTHSHSQSLPRSPIAVFLSWGHNWMRCENQKRQ